MSFLRNSITMLCWRAVAIGVGAVTAILLARWLGPEARGEVAIAVLTVSFVAVVVQAGVPEALIYAVGTQDIQRADILATTLGLAGMLGVAACVVVAGVSWMWMRQEWPISFMLALAAGATVGATFLRHLLIAEKKFAAYGLSVVTEGTAYVAGILCVARTVHLSTSTAILAYTASLVLVLVLLLWQLRARRIGRFHAVLAGACFRRGFHLFVTGLGGFGVQRMNFFLLEVFSGPTAVGLYAAANAMPSLFSSVPQQISTVLYSYVSSGDSASSRSLTRKVFAMSVVGLIIGLVPIFLLAEPIARLIFGMAYADIGLAIAILSVAMGLTGLAGILFNSLAGMGGHRVGSVATGINLLVVSAVGYFLVPVWGLLGAVIAQVAMSSVHLFFMISIYRRRTAVPVKDTFPLTSRARHAP